MSLEQLRKVPRVIGIAGGVVKIDAIRGALEGGLISTLITDRLAAERLVASAGRRRAAKRWTAS
jgi:DNA-binding transcriptional regulator LsrR (DeoR family)